MFFIGSHWVTIRAAVSPSIGGAMQRASDHCNVSTIDDWLSNFFSRDSWQNHE
jgi:hypothetical protein